MRTPRPISNELLEKMSTKRLLSIRRNVSARIGFLQAHDEGAWARDELETLLPFDQNLRRIMATREHVERPKKCSDSNSVKSSALKQQ
jgi:hypothetical protein